MRRVAQGRASNGPPIWGDAERGPPLRSVIDLVRRDPAARRRFELARRNRRRVDSVYEISTICNLRCEGCLFFDRDGGYAGPAAPPAAERFKPFFEAEHARGVNYPLLAGAETGLRQDVLRAAAEVWQVGMVHTNATIPIHRDIPFRLYVSIWGHRAATRKWRGGNCYDKVMRNITGDPRVLVNYTVTRANIDDIAPVVADCAARGVKITFQVYSPTVDYLDLLSSGAGGRHAYVHDSDGEINLVLRPADDRSACATIKNAIDAYPQTVLFTHDLADFVFSRPGIFCDSVYGNEVPPGCTAAHDRRHRHYRADMSVETHKSCGHPDVRCKFCRTYTTIYPGYFQSKLRRLKTEQDAREYLYAHEIYHELFFLN